MGVQLLDKTRKINKLLHNNSSSKVVFNDICEVLTEILNSNVLVISKKGKVLGGSKCEGVPYITELIEREIGKHVDDMLNERLLSILSTKENVNLQTLGFSEEAVKGYLLEIRKEWANQSASVVRIAQIESRIMALKGVLDIANTKINDSESNLMLTKYQIPVFGGVVND